MIFHWSFLNDMFIDISDNIYPKYCTVIYFHPVESSGLLATALKRRGVYEGA